jgi:hypothetical protein
LMSNIEIKTFKVRKEESVSFLTAMTSFGYELNSQKDLPEEKKEKTWDVLEMKRDKDMKNYPQLVEFEGVYRSALLNDRKNEMEYLSEKGRFMLYVYGCITLIIMGLAFGMAALLLHLSSFDEMAVIALSIIAIVLAVTGVVVILVSHPKKHNDEVKRLKENHKVYLAKENAAINEAKSLN